MAQDPLTLPFTHRVLWVEAWGAVACAEFQSLWLPETKKREFGSSIVGTAMPSAIGPIDFSLLWFWRNHLSKYESGDAWEVGIVW